MRIKGFSWIIAIALLVLTAALLIAIVGNVFTPFSMTQQNLLVRLKPPSFLVGGDLRYPLGTDRIGRDLVARLIAGLRMSLTVALIGTMLGAIVGTTIGFIAAHFRGFVEEVLMMLVDFQASLPFILIALTLLAFFGNSFTLFVILMGVFGWERYARARARRGAVGGEPALCQCGHRARRVAMAALSPPHSPNVASVLIVQLTLNFPQIILFGNLIIFPWAGHPATPDQSWPEFWATDGNICPAPGGSRSGPDSSSLR